MGIVKTDKKTSYYDYFLVTYDTAWDANLQYGCLCDVGFRGVACSIVECPTSYDAMDSETCEKYSEWVKWGTYASNEKALQDKNGNPKSPSLIDHKGNTILIREWNKPPVAPSRSNTTRLRSTRATAPPLVITAVAVVIVTPPPVSASASAVSQVPLVRRLLIFSKYHIYCSYNSNCLT